MRESGPVLLVLSVFDAKLFLRKAKFYLRNVNLASDKSLVESQKVVPPSFQ